MVALCKRFVSFSIRRIKVFNIELYSASMIMLESRCLIQRNDLNAFVHSKVAAIICKLWPGIDTLVNMKSHNYEAMKPLHSLIDSFWKDRKCRWMPQNGVNERVFRKVNAKKRSFIKAKIENGTVPRVCNQIPIIVCAADNEENKRKICTNHFHVKTLTPYTTDAGSVCSSRHKSLSFSKTIEIEFEMEQTFLNRQFYH